MNSTARCDVCADGYYALKRNNIFGCEPCRCSLGGSLHSICDKQTGQCVCRPSIVGRECNQPATGHYFPSLHQLQYELEDGVTKKQQTPVRYEFDSNEFANFSWKGYVRYSGLQSEVQLPLQLMKPTAYRILIRYKTYNGTSVNMNSLDYKIPQMHVLFAPIRDMGTTAAPQTLDIDLPPSDRQAAYASSITYVTSEAAPFNEYLLTLKTTDPVLVDYIVFIPIDYIEAQALQQTDPFAYGRPCELGSQEECYQYSYPSLNGMSSISQPVSGSMPSSYFLDPSILQELSVNSLTLIERSRDYRYDWLLSKPGQYYLVVDYHTINAGTSQARVQTIDGDMVPGSLALTDCPYTFICRQIVTTLGNNGNQRVTKPKLMTVTDTRRATVILSIVQQTDSNSPIGIHKITAVPVSQFNYELLRPKFSCVRSSSEDNSHGLSICDNSNRASISSTAPIQIFQAEDYYNEHLKTPYPPLASSNVSVVPLNFSTPNIYVYGRLTDVYAKPEDYPAAFQFHVHYYQLNSHGTSDLIPLTVVFYSRTGESQIGEINAPICQRRTPGGCSQIISLLNGSTSIRLDEPEFTIYLALVNPNTSLYIDFLTAQKIDPMADKVAVASTTPRPTTMDGDRASKFVQECIAKSAPNYDLKLQRATPFCQQALYSLSATFNEQAYPCLCDARGSLDPSGRCESYGGQCNCKRDVIGRRCNRCRTGFWGFPDCRPCACPTKICNEVTGDCICPPRVTGRYCDQCAPRTYGFGKLFNFFLIFVDYFSLVSCKIH